MLMWPCIWHACIAWHIRGSLNVGGIPVAVVEQLEIGPFFGASKDHNLARQVVEGLTQQVFAKRPLLTNRILSTG